MSRITGENSSGPSGMQGGTRGVPQTLAEFSGLVTALREVVSPEATIVLAKLMVDMMPAYEAYLREFGFGNDGDTETSKSRSSQSSSSVKRGRVIRWKRKVPEVPHILCQRPKSPSLLRVDESVLAEDGFCYLKAVLPEYRARAMRELGADPTFFSLLSYPAHCYNTAGTYRLTAVTSMKCHLDDEGDHDFWQVMSSMSSRVCVSGGDESLRNKLKGSVEADSSTAYRPTMCVGSVCEVSYPHVPLEVRVHEVHELVEKRHWIPNVSMQVLAHHINMDNYIQVLVEGDVVRRPEVVVDFGVVPFFYRVANAELVDTDGGLMRVRSGSCVQLRLARPEMRYYSTLYRFRYNREVVPSGRFLRFVAGLQLHAVTAGAPLALFRSVAGTLSISTSLNVVVVDMLPFQSLEDDRLVVHHSVVTGSVVAGECGLVRARGATRAAFKGRVAYVVPSGVSFSLRGEVVVGPCVALAMLENTSYLEFSEYDGLLYYSVV